MVKPVAFCCQAALLGSGKILGHTERVRISSIHLYILSLTTAVARRNVANLNTYFGKMNE